MSSSSAYDETARLASEFAADRAARQRRRHLEPQDFARLRETGFPLLAMPLDAGGRWESLPASTRPICETLRALARGDSSVALVASMHPSVLTYWLAFPEAPEPHTAAWEAQRREIFQSVREGAWWGTITSEPGSGGDVSRTKAAAAAGPEPGTFRLTGLKHFGSGSGIATHMVTTAVPQGETGAEWFYVDMRGAPWDGSRGLELVAEWEGQGMTATQSHSLRFTDFPAVRFAWPGNLLGVSQAAGGAIGCYFAAVIVGIVQEAMATARRQLAGRKDNLRPYEQVEWSQAEVDAWLIEQAYEGMLAAVAREAGTPLGVRCGKVAIAALAETLLGRLCRVIGGGSFTRYSPFSHWFEDVRALGFLRPPWGLAFDALFQASCAPDARG